MFKYFTLIILLILIAFSQAITAQETVISNIRDIELTGNDIIKVEANVQKGFNFPFFLFIPETIDKNKANYLFVETNNTGTTSDDLEVHLEKALNLVKRSYANTIARGLNVPLLVPVFPRPSTQWQCYTHALDRDTLEINSGQLKRIDLQLIAMIDFAYELLEENEIQIKDKIFMHGYSASAKFCNRFAFLYPKRVKAVASGGVNGLPTLPINERNGYVLPFPIGVADIDKFTGEPYDEQAHKHIAQYVYMGYLDRNDTLPSRDAWSEEEARIISEAIAETMMPDRWKISRDVYKEKLPCAQCVTYNGTGHEINDEIINDLIKFFKANSGDEYVAIEPHSYPFVEYKQIKEAHVNGLYWKGDKRLPEFVGKYLREDMFLLGIKEWISGQDHRQLDDFNKNAGFNFRLKADGHPDIVITDSNYGGNSSMSNGEFQAYYVRLNQGQLKVLEPNIPYTLFAENKSKEYVWKVNEGVKLIRSISYETSILAKLNNTFPAGKVELDANIISAIEFLRLVVSEFEYSGEMVPIHYQLQAETAQIEQMPKISFSAEGLSAMEILMIICHRASMDYRIEGTTVYIEKNDK